MTVGRGVEFKKTTVEECCRIDMVYLTEHYSMEAENSFVIGWTNNFGRTDAINIDIIPPNRLRLGYAMLDRQGNVTDQFDYYAPIETTPCHYGGRRWWFRCPGCNRRCRILYRPPESTYFACRVCHNLTYTSRQVGKTQLGKLWDMVNNYRGLKAERSRSRSKRQRASIDRKLLRMKASSIVSSNGSGDCDGAVRSKTG